MYIKVYKDGSKIKSKVAGLTFRQFIFLLSIAGVTGLIMINNFSYTLVVFSLSFH